MQQRAGSGRVPAWCAAWLVVFIVGAAHAQDPPPADPLVPEAEPWEVPSDPKGDDFDWMRFNNGEWLKGEITELQDDAFTFDSDEMDELSLDFSDVYSLHSKKVNTLVFADKSTVEGTFEIVGNTITVTTPSGEVKTYPRSELRVIIPGKMTEWNFWSGKFSVGGTIRQGNVDQADLSAFFRVQRRSPSMRLVLEYNGAYSTVDSVKTANNHRLLITNDVFLTRRLFLRVPSFEYFKDEFQNVDYRLTPGLLVGYDIIDRDGLEWSLSGGAGYQVTRFVDVPAGGQQQEEDSVLLLASSFSWEATKKLDVVSELSLAVPVGGSNNVLRFMVGTEIDVWKSLDFDIKIIIDHQSDPAPLSDGSVPLKTDLRLFFGLGFDF